MEYKVFIPSAGLGSRLGDLSKNINKSLITIYKKPVISYIIEKFPNDIEIIIAVGHNGQLIKDFISLAYPNRNIKCVDVDIYEGPGSGLGYTLLKCEQYLQCPFIFFCNDTIVIEDIPLPYYNWMGYANIYDNKIYRSLKIKNNKVIEINEKNYIIESPAYIGLAGIYNYAEFWKNTNEGIHHGGILIGETYGLRKIIPYELKAIKFSWFDTGNINALNTTINFYDTKEYNLLRKPNESIWFIENKVIKYSHDKNFIRDRIIRNKQLNHNLFPKIIDSRDNMYVYEFIPGIILSKCINYDIFDRLLKELKLFWKIKKISLKETMIFKEKCLEFYKDRTFSNMNEYFTKYNYEDSEETINGIKIPKLIDILEKIDWDNISNCIPSTYHGDLHFENIILSESNKFVFLDWRQNFAGLIEYGDIYYDLAKLLHSMVVSHEMVNKNHYFLEDNDKNIKVNIYRSQVHVEAENIFLKFLNKEKYDIKKVKILTALVYLNSALHHHDPYSKFLFFFGKYTLYNELNETY